MCDWCKFESDIVMELVEHMIKKHKDIIDKYS